MVIWWLFDNCWSNSSNFVMVNR